MNKTDLPIMHQIAANAIIRADTRVFHASILHWLLTLDFHSFFLILWIKFEFIHTRMNSKGVLILSSIR